MQTELALLEEVSALSDRAMFLVDDGDRSPLSLHGSPIIFRQGDPKNAEIIFNVPSDAHYYASRLNLYLSHRIISLTAPTTESDLTYRPCDWVHVGLSDTIALGDQTQFRKAGATFDIRDTNDKDRENAYQNVPLDVMSAFSGRYANTILTPVSSFLGGRDFHIPYFIRRGCAMIVKIASGFSLQSTATTRVEFRITGLLTGYKKVRAFR